MYQFIFNAERHAQESFCVFILYGKSCRLFESVMSSLYALYASLQVDFYLLHKRH